MVTCRRDDTVTACPGDTVIPAPLTVPLNPMVILLPNSACSSACQHRESSGAAGWRLALEATEAVARGDRY
jgi:hypothetical protein